MVPTATSEASPSPTKGSTGSGAPSVLGLGLLQATSFYCKDSGVLEISTVRVLLTELKFLMGKVKEMLQLLWGWPIAGGCHLVVIDV